MSKKLSMTFINTLPDDLFNYLNSVSGIISINKKDFKDEAILVNFEYDETIIKPQLILDEIELYMKPYFRPEMVSFNKHMVNAKLMKFDNPHICCEFCFLNCVYDLFYDNYINSFSCDLEKINEIHNPVKSIEISYIKDEINIKDVVNKYCDSIAK